MVTSMGRREERVYDAWVVVRRAEEVPGEWVAHCLDFDLVTQGVSLTEATDAAIEAIGMVLVDDIDADLDPYARRAPQRFWTDLYETISESRPMGKLDVGALNQDEVGTLVFRTSFTCVRECDDGAAAKPKVSVPLAFERMAHAQA